MAPGHESSIANFTPSRGVSPKRPFSMRMAPIPLQCPCVGKALNWHGQPQEQLQLTTSSPLICHFVLIVSAIYLPPDYFTSRKFRLLVSVVRFEKSSTIIRA